MLVSILLLLPSPPINLNQPIGKMVMPVASKFPSNNLPACIFVFPLLTTPLAITLR